MTRSIAIFLLTFVILVAGSFWLHCTGVNREAAFLEEIAVQAELNKGHLLTLRRGLSQLHWQWGIKRKCLIIYYDYFTVCTNWDPEGIRPR
jgi:hypothetical protein